MDSCFFVFLFLYFSTFFVPSAICSFVPNVEKINITGSHTVRDKDVRLLTHTCSHLKEITISNCKLLTTEAFSKSKGLKRLKKMNISYCSYGITGNLFENFHFAQFSSINLDGISLKTFLPIFEKLEKNCKLSLQQLSCKYCPFFDLSDVIFVVSHFPFLTDFNFHGSPAALKKMEISSGKFSQHYCEYNSLLEYKNSVENDFIGFYMTVNQQKKVRQYSTVRKKIVEHISSRKISEFFKIISMKKRKKDALE